MASQKEKKNLNSYLRVPKCLIENMAGMIFSEKRSHYDKGGHDILNFVSRNLQEPIQTKGKFPTKSVRHRTFFVQSCHLNEQSTKKNVLRHDSENRGGYMYLSHFPQLSEPVGVK